LRNLLSRLNITCDNQPYGCNSVLKLDALGSHLEECEHNPKRPLPCENGCGFVIPKDEFKDHNCVRELRSLCHTQAQKLAELKTEITDQNLTINELKRELNLIKDFMRAMRISNPAMRAIADQMERDEVLRWSNSLPRARVTRWGGMISTPDDSLQVSSSRNPRVFCNQVPNPNPLADDGQKGSLRIRMSTAHTRRANGKLSRAPVAQRTQLA